MRATGVRTEDHRSWLPRPPALARNLPWILLILLSISFAELLTGSTPVPALVLDPLSGVFLVGLYGAGVLLVREAGVRWAKGWPSILLLGVAYGISEEGLGTKTFFGPKGVGYLATYGHALGVNWVGATELALFQALFSIALPIAVVGLVFPAPARSPWLTSRRSLGFVLGAFVATVAAMFVLVNPSEDPGLPLVATALALLAALGVLARLVPATLGDPRATGPDRGVRGYRAVLVGATFVWGFFGLSWIGPRGIPYPALTAGAIAAWTIGFGAALYADRASWAAPGAQLGFISGALSFPLTLALAGALLGDPAVLVVVGAVVLLLVDLHRAGERTGIRYGARAPAPGGRGAPR